MTAGKKERADSLIYPEKISFLTLARTILAMQEAIVMKKLLLPDMKINWNWTCPLTGKQENWAKCMKHLFSLYNTQGRIVAPGRRERNEVIPPIFLAFCLEAPARPQEDPSRYDNLAEMRTKRSEFVEAEVAGIFEAEY